MGNRKPTAILYELIGSRLAYVMLGVIATSTCGLGLLRLAGRPKSLLALIAFAVVAEHRKPAVSAKPPNSLRCSGCDVTGESRGSVRMSHGSFRN